LCALDRGTFVSRICSHNPRLSVAADRLFDKLAMAIEGARQNLRGKINAGKMVRGGKARAAAAAAGSEEAGPGPSSVIRTAPPSPKRKASGMSAGPAPHTTAVGYDRTAAGGAPKRPMPGQRNAAAAVGTKAPIPANAVPAIDDPVKWDKKRCIAWLTEQLGSASAAEAVHTYKVGGTMLTRIGKSEFLSRAVRGGASDKRATNAYLKLNELLTTAKKHRAGFARR
jgi:hypothetical protein